jgi:hypothetical protein
MSYGFSKQVVNLSLERAESKVREEMSKEGFGRQDILTIAEEVNKKLKRIIENV